MDSEEAMNNARREKQLFLKAEIIDEGFSGADFAEFLDSKKPEGGSDIDVWSMDELRQLVGEFKIKLAMESLGETDPEPVVQEPIKQQQQSPSAQASQQKQGPGVSQFPSSDESKQRVDQKNVKFEEQKKNIPVNAASMVMNKNNNTNSSTRIETSELDSFTNKQKARVADTTILNTSPSDVKVSVGERPELNKGGMFSGSFITYKVRTEPFNWLVKRRFSDFTTIRNVLLKMHPGIPIPHLPEKKVKKFENKVIRKRIYILERFCNFIVKQADYKSNPYLVAFLSLTDEKKFRSYMKDADKIKAPSRVDEILKPSGVVTLEVSSEYKQFAELVGDLTQFTEPMYKNIKKLSKQLIKDLEKASHTMISLAECYETLYKHAEDFNNKTPIGKNKKLNDVYFTLNNMMATWSEQTLGQIKMVETNFKHFYKYTSYENASFVELLKSRADYEAEHMKKAKDLLTKKEKYFQAGDPSKWEIPYEKFKEHTRDEFLKNKSLSFEYMFPKDTGAVKDVRDWFAFYNNSCYEELSKQIDEKIRQYGQNFHTFASEQLETMSMMQLQWNDLVQLFYEEKKPQGSSQLLNRQSVMRQEKDYKLEGAEE